MYYSNGNYEAFARPEKPEGVDRKSAYLVGGGLASLAAACFLIRDGQMKGEHIHILEELKLPGGACDGIEDPQKGFIIRAAARWRTTLNAFGICSEASPLSRRRACPFWMNTTGSTSMTPTILSAV